MTKNIKKLVSRSSNFLRRVLQKPAWEFSHFVADPRDPRGRRWQLKVLLEALFLGFLVNRSSLRNVESLTEMVGNALPIKFSRRLPDSTLYDLLERLEPQPLRQQLHAQIKEQERSKSLAPLGLPVGVVAVDNKTIWSGKPDEAQDPNCQDVHSKDRPPYSQLRVVRSCLISAASTPVIDQVVIAKKRNEGSTFPEVFEVLEANYAALIEVYSMDAGFCSLKNANTIAAAQKGYIFALKENQPELYREAERLLGHLQEPEYSSDYEAYQGNLVRYHLYRSSEIAGYLKWRHLEQVWRVEKEIVTPKSGDVKRENHYAITNVSKGRFNAKQVLNVSRRHWAIENNCNWSADVIWDEDSKSWSTRGLAIQVLSLLRMMALNVIQHLRHRYLKKKEEKRRFREWFDFLFLAITREVERAKARLPQEL